jgi:hypothetical protein
MNSSRAAKGNATVLPWTGSVLFMSLPTRQSIAATSLSTQLWTSTMTLPLALRLELFSYAYHSSQLQDHDHLDSHVKSSRPHTLIASSIFHTLSTNTFNFPSSAILTTRCSSS